MKIRSSHLFRLNASSFEVGFLWERAACSLDDDVGGVVCSLHTLIQRFLLDQLRQETCATRAHVRIQKTDFAKRPALKCKSETTVGEILTSYESITGTSRVNDVLRANFHNRKCFNLVTCTKIDAEKRAEEQNLNLKYAR